MRFSLTYKSKLVGTLTMRDRNIYTPLDAKTLLLSNYVYNNDLRCPFPHFNVAPHS